MKIEFKNLFLKKLRKMSCSNCGQNRDIRLPYSICYIVPLNKMSEIWENVCQICCLDLGYAREFSEEELKLERNERGLLWEELEY